MKGPFLLQQLPKDVMCLVFRVFGWVCRFKANRPFSFLGPTCVFVWPVLFGFLVWPCAESQGRPQPFWGSSKMPHPVAPLALKDCRSRCQPEESSPEVV